MAEIRKDTRIKVCFVSPKAYPLFNPAVKSVFGGAEVDLYMLATELAKDDGFEVSCVAADYGQGQIETVENVTVIKSLDFGQNAVAGAVKIWRAMKKADADIYVIKTASPGVPLVALFCKLHKKVFVYRTAHQRECDGTYVKEHFFGGRAFARSLRSAKIVFAQNEDDSQKLKDTLGVDSIVIPNGHRIEDITEARKETVLWVGRSADFKKPKLFLDLARRLSDEKFVMICQRATGDNNYQELAANAKQIENLTFIEQVPFGEIDLYFRDAKVLVNTSDSEGFANTFIQAAKYATAILSLNVNPDNFLEKYNCGICAKGDVGQMEESLMTMLEEDRYIDMGANGRKYVEECHDIAEIVQRYKDLFGAAAK